MQLRVARDTLEPGRVGRDPCRIRDVELGRGPPLAPRNHVLSSCCSQVVDSDVGRGRGLGGDRGALDLAEDVEDDDTADVEETDQHDCLGAELEASGVFREEGQLVALAVCAALLLRERRALVPGLAAVDYTLFCAFFC